MKNIEPSQFLELLLSQQKQFQIDETVIGVIKFNKMVDELSNLNLFTRFGFSDFLEFIDRVHSSIPYKEFAIHISFTEQLMNDVRRYNSMYEEIKELNSALKLWEDFLK